MPFAHESLEVYKVALDFLVFANEIVESVPRGKGHLADQLARASTSIVLNIAEGAGKYSRPDKRRYYVSAIGSTTECAAILDICLRLALIGNGMHVSGKAALERTAAMLVKLAKAQER
ncbi:MAG TPA: four helix bundle protein [Kofleriaceae bacterium]|nr:four helix bundle protein [Kofleriaceae bacterium]